jgi:uncharacterized phage protein (TIGR01671 family)
MKELKFRAFRKHKNSAGDMDYSKNWVSMSEFFEHLERNYPEAIIMQYTGLNDKNGKEIYEGDIVHSFTPNRESTGAIIDYDDEVTVFYDIRNAVDQYLFLIEPRIVGNIHKNPELLPNKN